MLRAKSVSLIRAFCELEQSSTTAWIVGEQSAGRWFYRIRLTATSCRTLAVVLALATAAVLLAACSRTPSSYYRVTAKLMHGSEPVTIDWVVECRYTARAGEMRGYTRLTYEPVAIGVRTQDDGMVIMSSPAYCGKKAATSDYVPFLMWGDKAGDFSFFTACVARAAFDTPASKLKILSVDLKPADEAEYWEWKKTAPKNLVPEKHNPFLADSRGSPAICLGISRIPDIRDSQAAVEAARPFDAGQYWIGTLRLWFDIMSKTRLDRTKSNRTALSEGYGLLPSEEEYPFETYPLGSKDYFVRHFQNNVVVKDDVVNDINIDEETPGFMSCGALPFQSEFPHKTRFVFRDGTANPFAFRVSDEFVIVKLSKTAFISRDFSFDIERGDEEHG